MAMIYEWGVTFYLRIPRYLFVIFLLASSKSGVFVCLFVCYRSRTVKDSFQVQIASDHLAVKHKRQCLMQLTPLTFLLFYIKKVMTQVISNWKCFFCERKTNSLSPTSNFHSVYFISFHSIFLSFCSP